MTYIPLDAPKYKEQEYIGFREYKEQEYIGFRGGDLNSFRDIQQYPFPGGWVDPRGNDLHTIGCPLT
jgi:hypothetical protein